MHKMTAYGSTTQIFSCISEMKMKILHSVRFAFMDTAILLNCSLTLMISECTVDSRYSGVLHDEIASQWSFVNDKNVLNTLKSITIISMIYQ